MEPDVKCDIIKDMTLFARQHASFIFTGIARNYYMRLKNNKRQKDIEDKSKQMSSLQKAHWEAENHKDLEYSNLRCLDFMKQVFVNSDGQQIFKRIDGPYDNQIDVF